MSTVAKVIGAAILVVCVAIGAVAGPALALTMAYMLWGWKGLLFTLGLLLAK